MDLSGNVCTIRASQESVGHRLASVGERLMLRHFERDNFRAGVELGAWRMVSFVWPHAIFMIGEVSSNRGREAFVSFSLEGYPLGPPTLQLWDVAKQTSIAAHAWPTWFVDFITRYHPGLVQLDLQPYSPELLTISTAIIRRLKQRRAVSWYPSGDITQVLCRLVECFRSRRQVPFEYPLAG
jgi:hypothetical protein